MQYEIDVGGRLRQVVVHRVDGLFLVAMDGREVPVDAVAVDANTWSMLIDGVSHEVTVSPSGTPGGFFAGVGATQVAVSLNGRRRWGHKDDKGAAGPQRLTAPMPGKIVRVLVKPGDAVSARQPLVVIEAMKMENELRAAGDGTVAEVRVSEGQSVDAGTLLAVLTGAD
jgi:biotin carboxyl carrier protein